MDTLKRAGGLQNTHLEDHRELVDEIFAQVTHSVSQLSSSWNVSLNILNFIINTEFNGYFIGSIT